MNNHGFFLISLCLVLCVIATSSAGAKPLPPVQVSITPEQAPGQENAVEFVVRASVTTDAENVQISVSIPYTLNALSGELQWQGPMLKGQEKLLRFTAKRSQVPTDNNDDPVIHVQAVITSNESSRLAASAFYRWRTAAAKTVGVQVETLDARVVERHGIVVQEYELRP